MIKFFRNIRKVLLAQSRFKKYLLYAIGEVVLVMVGILLALETNNWNNNRKDANQEKEILTELKAEYLSKLDELNQKIQLRNSIISQSDDLLEIIFTKNTSVAKDSIYYKMFYLIVIPTFDASNSVTHELINSGKLYILKNKTLRNHITKWQSELQKMTEEEQHVRLHSFSGSLEYLENNYPISNFINSISMEDYAIDSLMFKENSFNKKRRTKSSKPFNIDFFVNDYRTENFIEFTNFMHRVANRQAISLKNHIHKVKWLIEQELKRFEN